MIEANEAKPTDATGEEHGAASLSIASLAKMTSALGVTLSGLFADPEADDVDQFAMVIKRAVLSRHDGRDIKLTRGDFLMLPAGPPHRWQNRSLASAKILFVSSRR